jgi:hypothetical protein
MQQFDPKINGYYYVAINVTSYTCKHSSDPFPLLATTGLHYLDKYMFNLICEHYDIKYEFVTGVCFQSFNTKLRDLINKLYALRLRYKRNRSEIQHVLKRLMNSFFGKSIQKQNPTYKVKVLKNKIADYKEFNKHFIYSLRSCNDTEFDVSLVKTLTDKWSVPQFACNVLSYSKLKMAQLAYECVDLGIKLYYINTDCLTLTREDFDTLNSNHNNELLSDQIGQFSIEVESKMFIALGPYKNLHVLKDGSLRVRYPCKLDNALDFFNVKFWAP